jgi:hypothetical protein
MKPEIKAVVFRTPRLTATKVFFTNQLGLTIREYSATHFVIHSKGIRILFVESKGDPEVEIYLGNSPLKKLIVLEDPNHIKIISS